MNNIKLILFSAVAVYFSIALILTVLVGTMHPERYFKKGPFHAASFIINSMLFGPAIFVMILINERRDDAGL